MSAGADGGHLADLVRARLGPAALLRASVFEDNEELTVDSARYLPVLRCLAADRDTQLDVLVDLFAVDLGQDAEPRFELRVVLRSRRLGYRAHVVCLLRGEDPVTPTLTAVWPAASWLEREVFEMHGITSEGHAQLRPLLLYEGFVGHPLRRDYRAHKQQPLVPVLDAQEGAAAATVISDTAEVTP